VHPLPASGEDAHGVWGQTRIDVANTAAGSGLHDADCSVSCIFDSGSVELWSITVLGQIINQLQIRR